MLARINLTSLLVASPLLSGSLGGLLVLSLEGGHLLLLRDLLLLPLLFESPCLLLSVRGFSLLVFGYLRHHLLLGLSLTLHHLCELVLSGLFLLLAALVIALPVFGGSDGDCVHLSLKLCHLRCMLPFTIFLISLSSVIIFVSDPVLPFLLPPGLSLVPHPVLLSHPLFGLRGLLSHVLHSAPHLVVHLLLSQRLLLSYLAVFLHGLYELHHDRLHL